MSHLCSCLEPLTPGPSVQVRPGVGFMCDICNSGIKPDQIVLGCKSCNMDICNECMKLTTKLDTALALHLNQLDKHNDFSMLKEYKANPECATQLIRSPYMASVYWQNQKLYNTEEHRENLRRAVKLAAEAVEEATKDLREKEDLLAYAERDADLKANKKKIKIEKPDVVDLT